MFSTFAMSFLLAIIGYFLAALVFVLDRYILHSRIPSPSVYAFFVGMFSIFGLLVAPFGLGFFGWGPTLLALLSGVLFVWGLVALYSAIAVSDISRIAPLVGSLATAFVLLVSQSGILVASESFDAMKVWAICLLVGGGLLLSLQFPFKRRVFFRGFAFSVMAGVFLALFSLLYKAGAEGQNFVSDFVYSRLGMVLGAFSLLLYAPFRKKILHSCCRVEQKERRKRQWTTVIIFVGNKTLSGVSYFCNSLAITLGSVVAVQALASVQYAFVVVLSGVASVWIPSAFRQKMNMGFAIQMVTALTLIAVGTVFVAISGGGVVW